MSEIVVTLSASELTIAAQVACQRQIDAIVKGRTPGFGLGRHDGWTEDVEGACGEMAVAKWAGKYWTGNFGDLGADDVGRLQVRTTSRHNGCLLLHQADPDDRAFVLVTGIAPTFTLRGWVWGREGKQEQYWDEKVPGRPCFFVPQSALRAMKKGTGGGE